MKAVISLFKDSFTTIITGNRIYHIWMGLLTLIMLIGGYAYYIQVRDGLVVTNMSDRVSWGLYISNFTFLVGVAAAAVMLVLPTYILHKSDFKRAVLVGEGMAVAALIMCLAFVVADMGSPENLWHMIPIIGVFNWPNSMLTWDVLVLNGYLLINITVPFYILFKHYKKQEANKNIYLPGVIISVFWAVGIHLVTAFLYSGLASKPFWNSALLGPRFLASAFCAGPALMILVLAAIRKFTEFEISNDALKKLALITTVAAQINLVMLGSELFKEFYHPTHHSLSAQYLFFGLEGKNSLVPWVWTALTINVLATIILTINRFRNNMKWIGFSCALLFVAVWIEKGMGLIVPGFIPGPWGEIAEYAPNWIEIAVTLGIWALGCFVFTMLAKVAVKIEMGQLTYNKNK
ncbi:MAG: sulfate reduction electron transfer complex DsrMKJOP subunit DsrP [Bacteroidia bacterium]